MTVSENSTFLEVFKKGNKNMKNANETRNTRDSTPNTVKECIGCCITRISASLLSDLCSIQNLIEYGVM